MPILGVIASSTRQGLATSSFESIQTYIVGAGGQATIVFSAIPQTYKHLQVRYLARSGRARNQNSGLVMRLNTLYGDYSHQLSADGSTVSAGGGVPSIGGLLLEAPGTTAPANVFGAGIVDIIDYQSSVKYPVMRAFSGVDTSTAGRINISSQYLSTTSGISTITFETVDGGTNIQQYSHFALYGIKG